jgi:WD40 repeat protein
VGGTVKLWDTATGELKQTLRGHSDVVDAVAFSPDDKIVASGSYDTTVLLWDAQSGDLRKTLSNAGKVTSVAFSHNGLTLAGGSWDKTVRLWQ